MIPVNKPFLPPKEDYVKLLDTIWESHWLTNMGPLAKKLESGLRERLQLENLLFVTNGTLAIQIAIRALELEGEIITTPFSYVATTSSIVWESCVPVFVDIDAESLNINPALIEEKITDKTSAILATHVYGNPCEVEKIQEIADKHNLKVIYDAAHALDVKYKGDSLFSYGDVSTCSLHATKLFHTGEGGLVVAKNEKILNDLFKVHNFGHDGPVKFSNLGINGKNSEFHAAMGLANMKYLDEIIAKRRQLSERYDSYFQKTHVRKPKWHPDGTKNYSYYPVIFKSEEELLNVVARLNENQVFGRRYFYPSLAKCLPYIEPQDLEVTDDIACRVLCLPLYYDLKIEEVDYICNIIFS